MGITITIGDRKTKIPEGEYEAKVIEDQVTEKYNKKTLILTFEVVTGPHKGARLSAFINAHYDSFTEHTKLWQWLAAVTKIDCVPGSQISTDLFYGKILKVKVATKQSKKTKNEFSNVIKILGVICDLENA